MTLIHVTPKTALPTDQYSYHSLDFLDANIAAWSILAQPSVVWQNGAILAGERLKMHVCTLIASCMPKRWKCKVLSSLDLLIVFGASKHVWCNSFRPASSIKLLNRRVHDKMEGHLIAWRPPLGRCAQITFPHCENPHSSLTVPDVMAQHIMRADAARILYMHTYGGCYVDLDFESLKPLDGLVSELPLALGSMGYEQSDHNVPNAFMCSSPGHQFWELCLETIEDKWLQSQQPGNPLNATQSDGIEQVTGPRMINVALKQWARGHSPVPLVEARHVYPYSWLMPVIEPRKAQRFEACQYLWGPFNAATCKSYFPEAYAVTYWTHTWEHVG